MDPATRRGSVAALVKALGVDLDPELLVLSLTHRSFAHEAGGIPTNERIEFLGDAVIGLVITEHLFREHPEHHEGDLAKMRAATVSGASLAEAARKIGLGSQILLGKGESTTGGADKDSILSDTFEALVGAVYLSHGVETTRQVVLRLMAAALTRAADLGAGLDWKTSLQELVSARDMGVIEYRTEATGPDHARVFLARAVIDGRVLGHGSGTAKKTAEQQAAGNAYQLLAEPS